MSHFVQLYRFDVLPIARHGFFTYNEALEWALKEMKESPVELYGFIIFNKAGEVEYFKSI